MNPHPQTFFDFTNKVVIVTGGSSGIGQGIAFRFAQVNANVLFTYFQNKAGGEETLAQVEAISGTATAVQADVTQKSAVENMVEQAVTQYGRVDILINNAGIYPPSSLEEMDEQEWDDVINANLRSTFLCTQAVAKQMIAQGSGGAIINIASIEGENPAPMHAHYNAAKGGVIMLTKAAAQEFGKHKIRVNTVSPGLIWRQGIEEAWPDGVARWQKAAPLTRLGQPDDIADACLFLASPAARWISGINLRVDGGVMTNQIF